ncbi:MAG: hypothetical protein WBA12_06935, partial [Catalinimonas sp.]
GGASRRRALLRKGLPAGPAARTDHLLATMKIPVTKREKWGTCQLCERPDQPLTFHHLIPKTNHRRKQFRRRFDKWELHTRGLNLCRPCHRHLHVLYDD